MVEGRAPVHLRAVPAQKKRGEMVRKAADLFVPQWQPSPEVGACPSQSCLYRLITYISTV